MKFGFGATDWSISGLGRSMSIWSMDVGSRVCRQFATSFSNAARSYEIAVGGQSETRTCNGEFVLGRSVAEWSMEEIFDNDILEQRRKKKKTIAFRL